jgi:hypothetical protein
MFVLTFGIFPPIFNFYVSITDTHEPEFDILGKIYLRDSLIAKNWGTPLYLCLCGLVT